MPSKKKSEWEVRTHGTQLDDTRSGEQGASDGDNKTASTLDEGGGGFDLATDVAPLSVVLSDHGSSKTALVEHIGFEPMTSSMPWKRASQLRQCPEVLNYYSKTSPLFP